MNLEVCVNVENVGLHVRKMCVCQHSLREVCVVLIYMTVRVHIFYLCMCTQGW